MRVVLDTNVIVSAFAARGICSDLYGFCLKECEIVLSQPILQEVQTALIQKLKLPLIKAQLIINFLSDNSHLVIPAIVAAKQCRDKNDLKILGTAMAANAAVIVTGDQDLLVIKSFKGIPILSPRGFWQLINT